MAVCWTVLAYAVFLPLLINATFREQSVAVKGIVNCRGVRQPGAFVQLYDEDASKCLFANLLHFSRASESEYHCVVKTLCTGGELQSYPQFNSIVCRSQLVF